MKIEALLVRGLCIKIKQIMALKCWNLISAKTWL